MCSLQTLNRRVVMWRELTVCSFAKYYLIVLVTNPRRPPMQHIVKLRTLWEMVKQINSQELQIWVNPLYCSFTKLTFFHRKFLLKLDQLLMSLFKKKIIVENMWFFSNLRHPPPLPKMFGINLRVRKPKPKAV